MQNIVMLRVITPSVFVLSFIMVSVIMSVTLWLFQYGECYYSGFLNATVLSDIMAGFKMLRFHLAEFQYAECHYSQCHYALCHYDDCHYAKYHYAEVVIMLNISMLRGPLCSEPVWWVPNIAILIVSLLSSRIFAHLATLQMERSTGSKSTHPSPTLTSWL